MKNKTTKISIRVIAIFLTAMVMSLIPDYFTSFFGDQWCEFGNSRERELCEFNFSYNNNAHLHGWHWGYRHWLWLLMGVALFIIQAVDIIIIADKKDNN